MPGTEQLSMRSRTNRNRSGKLACCRFGNEIQRVDPQSGIAPKNLKSRPDQHVYSSRSNVGGFFGWAWSTQTCASNSFLAPVIPWSTGVHHEQAVQVAAIPLVVTFHSIARLIIFCPDLIVSRFARNRVEVHQMRLRLQTCAWSGCALLRSPYHRISSRIVDQ
jgi:hypothetical protein